MSPEKRKDEPEPSFEEALARLETLVEEMDGGSLSLEAMMKHFEEGTRLIQFCNRKLDQVEKKIEVLIQQGQALATEPFEAGEAGA